MTVTVSASMRRDGVDDAFGPTLRQVHLPPRRSSFRLKLQCAIMAIDTAMLFAGMAIAHKFWVGYLAGPYLDASGAFIPLYLLAGANCRAFSSDSLPNARSGMSRAMHSILLAAAGLVLAVFFLKSGEQISRIALLMGFCLGAVFLITARMIFHRLIRRRFGALLYSEVLILDEFDLPAPPGAFVLDAGDLGLRCDMNEPMMLDRIGRMLAPADRVVIACSTERRRDWAMVLKGANIRGEIVSPELSVLGPLGTNRFGGGATVVVSTGSLDFRQRIIKRAFDLSMAVAMIVVLAPLLALVALAVRLDSPGAVLFIQDRVGRGNRLFGMYKFRSMRAETCDRAGHRSTARGDDRITRVGRFIRATSIDELPQLFNILKGDMSFVGPRPHALGSLAGDLLFWEVDERYWHRHACKPGITGLAQVRGFRGATHKQSDLVNRLQADLEYNSGWTLWRDISILLATLRVVVHRNAY